MYLELVLAIVLNVAGQLFFKRAAMSGAAPGTAAHKAFLSHWFIGGAGSLGASMLLWVLVLRELPLTLAHPITGAVFILVPLASHFLWKEPLPRTRLLGILVIIAGIYFVAQSGPGESPVKGGGPAACAPELSMRGLCVTEKPDLSRHLRDRGVEEGVIVLLDGDATTVTCNSAALCMKRYLPASTFKIANAMIGLDTGVAPDANFVIPWDGVKREFESWNQDHTLHSAMTASAIPYYQELARRTGPDRMRDWLQRLSYGNAEMGDRVDSFWLEGPLAIAPVEQVEFLRRLALGRLPIAERTRGIMLDMLVRKREGDATLRGKTGWGYPHTDHELGWFVGWSERGAQRVYVAVLTLKLAPGVDIFPVRQAIAESVLHEAGAW